MNPMMIAFALSVFLAIVLGGIGAYLWWNTYHSQRARRFSHRVEAALLNSAGHGQDAGILKQRVMSQSPALARLLRRLPRMQALDHLMLQSGMNMSVGRFLALTLAAPSLAGMVLATLNAPWYAVLLMAGALDMAGNELPAPIGTELGLVFGEINYGIPLHDALAGLTDRVPIEDLRYLVIAVLIQRESGGNLAEILDNVASLIRKRLQLLDKVRVLSAEGRLGGWILTLLPVVVGGIVFQINPEMMATLWTDPTGLQMLWYAVAMTCVGILWMRQIVRIHV